MLTMADLETQIVEVSYNVIANEEQTQNTVEMAILSYSEFNEIAAAVDLPDVPIVPKVVDGKKTLVRDDNDPVYRQALADAKDEIALRQLARSLVLAGNFPELKDQPVEVQGAAVAKLPRGNLMGLMVAMNRLHGFSFSEVKTKSKSFRGLRRAEVDDLPEDGVEPGAVEVVASNGAG
jgi:hypothetical protein